MPMVPPHNTIGVKTNHAIKTPICRRNAQAGKVQHQRHTSTNSDPAHDNIQQPAQFLLSLRRVLIHTRVAEKFRRPGKGQNCNQEIGPGERPLSQPQAQARETPLWSPDKTAP